MYQIFPSSPASASARSYYTLSQRVYATVVGHNCQVVPPVEVVFLLPVLKVLPHCDYPVTTSMPEIAYSQEWSLYYYLCDYFVITFVESLPMKPFLDLSHIAVDPNLAQQLPPGVARYYEALPIAREGDSVTVAMSHPENVTALAVLTQFFRAQIVPIRTDGAAVR